MAIAHALVEANPEEEGGEVVAHLRGAGGAVVSLQAMKPHEILCFNE